MAVGVTTVGVEGIAAATAVDINGVNHDLAGVDQFGGAEHTLIVAIVDLWRTVGSYALFLDLPLVALENTESAEGGRTGYEHHFGLVARVGELGDDAAGAFSVGEV